MSILQRYYSMRVCVNANFSRSIRVSDLLRTDTYVQVPTSCIVTVSRNEYIQYFLRAAILRTHSVGHNLFFYRLAAATTTAQVAAVCLYV